MPSRLHERLPWGSLRVRLAVWNTVVVLAMTLAALLAARYAARSTLYADADRELRGGAREVTLALQDLFPNMDAVVAEMRRKAASHEERGWFTQLLAEDGTRVWTSTHCPEEVAAFPPHNLDRPENVVQVGPYRYVRLRIAEPDQPVFHVRVGSYTTGLDESLSGLMRVLLGVGGVLCALTPLAGWWLAVQSTRPVADILATADRLDPTRLSDRLPVRGAGDELDHLAETINGLLDDVATHVDSQHQFVADAAHELRGPLAAVQSSLEVALSGDRDVADLREPLEEVLEETRYLTKLTNGLLTLAESGAAAADAMRTPVDLVEVARQAVAMFAGVGEERGVSVRLAEPDCPVVVEGDAAQLRQVVGNLLDNAMRFTPAGGAIDVRMAVDAAGAVLTVGDTGPGIAARHMPRLFDRFYKVDAARAHDGSGRSGGLGLSICKVIVERHGGTIDLASREGEGTTVTVRLPATPRSATRTQPHARHPDPTVAAR
jgi:two-component system heavy metal sensor histidine kinase CusS